MASFTLDRLLGIRYPIMVAPMFLVSNTRMIVAALECGVTAAFPALNFRSDKELRGAIAEIRSATDKPFGVNLIVNRSNPRYRKQLQTLLEAKVDYIITSLGNPLEAIGLCKPEGIKVFCDVVDLHYARKVEGFGADALIAVNSRAGGHAGNIAPQALVKLLKEHCQVPIISAGGIGRGADLYDAMQWGAAGASIGTLFIACEESDVSADYKRAIVAHGEGDIVKTTKLSGSPLTVINTPYVQQLGTEANWLERLMHRNRTLRKYVKLFIAMRGMKAVENAAFGATYKTVWCAGPAIEHVREILPIREILKRLISEFDAAQSAPVADQG